MEIYFDNSATTKICEEALEKYIEVSRNFYGNPSSLHAMGFNAEKLLAQARADILATLSARGCDLIFTASGSEANNLAITGRAYSKERYKKGAKIITTMGEHASVSEPLKRLGAEGFKIVEIPTSGGIIDMDRLAKELTSDTILVTMMMVNNETGALYDIAAVSKLAHAKCPDALVHVDATQSFLKLPFTKSALGADMITLSSHKIEGPKGVGALVIDERVKKLRGLSPIILGGGQEGGYRSGTENLPANVAFATAAKLGFSTLKPRFEKMSALRELVINEIRSRESLSGVSITEPRYHAPHIVNITLPKIKSETMLHYLSSLGIYVSSGSACSSNSAHTSSALVAFGRSAEEADYSIRISLSAVNTEDEVREFISALESGISKLARGKEWRRSLSSPLARLRRIISRRLSTSIKKGSRNTRELMRSI